MRVFLAGASGAIGRPLVARLLDDGHEVVGTTRDEQRARALRERGAEAVVLDAFDAEAVHAAVRAAEPEVVIHQLTALPATPDPTAMGESLELTARLRRETVPTFLAAARAAGARRVIVQSISFITRPDGRPVHDEDAPLFLDGGPQLSEGVRAVADMEASVRGAQGLEALTLRYGFFYGPGTWYARDGAIAERIRRRGYPIIGRGQGRMSFVHVDDAAQATARALDHGEPGIYNVTDDHPATQKEWVNAAAQALGAKRPLWAPPWLARRAAGEGIVYHATRLPGNANGRARAALQWTPRRWGEGFREVLA